MIRVGDRVVHKLTKGRIRGRVEKTTTVEDDTGTSVTIYVQVDGLTHGPHPYISKNIVAEAVW